MSVSRPQFICIAYILRKINSLTFQNQQLFSYFIYLHFLCRSPLVHQSPCQLQSKINHHICCHHLNSRKRSFFLSSVWPDLNFKMYFCDISKNVQLIKFFYVEISNIFCWKTERETDTNYFFLRC